MSTALYFTRLYWDGRHGVAKLHGVQMVLRAPPRLPGIDAPIEAIDYAPETRTAMVRERAAAWRDMTAGEVRAADDYLRITCASQPARAEREG